MLAMPELRTGESSLASCAICPPHGGELVDLLADPERSFDLQSQSAQWPSWDLTPRQLCDLHLLMNGGFSPLRGFMTRVDYGSVCRTMRLRNGMLWPIPIVLDISQEFRRTIDPGSTIALRDPEGVMLAALHVEDVWQPDRLIEAETVYGTTSTEHPGVARLLKQTNAWYAGGRVEGIQLPAQHDFHNLRHTPAELRTEFLRLGWNKVVAFQTRRPMHRAHQELTLRAAREAGAKLLIHPSVEMAKPGDSDYFIRVRCYEALLAAYPRQMVKLSLLPLALRMAGPREAVWHAIIRKNYGCSHFIVGREHASPGTNADGQRFYPACAAQDLLRSHQDELGIATVPIQRLVYLEQHASYVPDDQVPAGLNPVALSGAEIRRRLLQDAEIPSWFTFPEVLAELRKSYPPRHRQGFTIFFTGLSGSGKSTIANILRVRFLEMGGRPVTLLDGDIVRKHLSSELGFSREHRDINIRRIGFVAAEITKNGGIAICAPIAPYDSVRKEVRAMVESGGAFILVHLSTPLETCEARDRKGLYAKARAGLVQHFTGISDPYEIPTDAEIVLDTSQTCPLQAVEKILQHLKTHGYLRTEAQSLVM
jgi:sulfate adenylyltransferase